MIPHRITLENFLTFAGPVEFDFTGGEPLWVIGGPNGVGKSAVFDAVTFALFGVHRGGKQRFDELVRHGADSFRVVLEFGFCSTDYRITRAFSGGKQVTPKLESRPPGGAWGADRRVNKVADLTPLIEELLGLDYEKFTKSVMLKQGAADKLFSASREERAAILKGFIGFEQYEGLSERVHTATAKARGALEQLQRQFAGMRPVGEEELADAERVAAEAETARDVSRSSKDDAVARVERAKQWASLDARHRDLERQLAEADERARQSDHIRTRKARLDELAQVVPLCTTLVAVRTELATHTANRHRLSAAHDGATSRRRELTRQAEDQRTQSAGHKQKADGAASRQQEIAPQLAQNRKWLSSANELVALAGELSRFPEHLREGFASAKEAETAAEGELKDAEKLFTEADTLLAVTRDENTQFSSVEAGVPCPHCRQPVSEEHAADVRRRLQEKLRDLQTSRDECDTRKKDAARKHKTATSARHAFEKQVADRALVETRFNTKQEALERDGGSTDVSRLTGFIATLESDSILLTQTVKEQRQLQASTEESAARLSGEAALAQQEMEVCDSELRNVATQIATLTGRHEEVALRIPEPWGVFATDVSAETLQPLAAELSTLRQSDVSALFARLAQDAVQRGVWVKHRDDARDAIAAMPAGDRVPEAEAITAREGAATAAEDAESAAARAATALRELRAGAEAYSSTASTLGTAEHGTELHKRLDDLLGEKGLQRDLIRAAEHEVVALADDTLRRLSNQELSIEPDPAATGRADKAFALRVRKAGDPNPIGVDFISGSQKFRVAVSLALALGRFAAGKQRPIEAVIIDEGFGSLDEDGLRAMAENLHELRRAQLLKRILLVSHQRNFTDQFSAGYRLTPGESGTTAERLT